MPIKVSICGASEEVCSIGYDIVLNNVKNGGGNLYKIR